MRTLRIICNGTLRVVGVQQGFPPSDLTAPHVVELVPAPREIRELARLCSAQQTETPRRIIYHGVDLPSLTDRPWATTFRACRRSGSLDTSTNRLVPLDFDVLIGQFVLGELTIPIIEAGLGSGLPLGTVSDKTSRRAPQVRHRDSNESSLCGLGREPRPELPGPGDALQHPGLWKAQ